MDKELHEICCWGAFNHLVTYERAKLTPEVIKEALFRMNCKLQEISVWKTEELNQHSIILQKFDNRVSGIIQCMNYLSNLSTDSK
jgi:hypothetical protein